METVNRSIKELSQFEVIYFKENRLAVVKARIKEIEENLLTGKNSWL